MHLTHHPLAEKHDIAMPTMRARDARDRHRVKPRFPLHPCEIEKPTALTEACIRLLQRDDIRTDFADYLGDPARIEFAIDPDAFVHIVGCHEQAR
ncbi:hypothetical protein D3C73_1182460 [compost metagenome]